MVNRLRVEVFDHDDSLIDSTDDFMGMMVLEGEGDYGERGCSPRTWNPPAAA